MYFVFNGKRWEIALENIKKLQAAIKNNRTALIIGKAGTAKTAYVHEVAEGLGMPVETLLLAGILPEDMGGLVRPTEDGRAFDYLPPAWALKHGNDPFVLFLDEVNQASIQTLHAMFYMVNDRTVAGINLPNMRVIAAGNGADENEFLTPLPDPLLDRFVYKIKWSCNIEGPLEFLKDKYKHLGRAANVLLDSVEQTWTEDVTPRHVEQMLMMIEDKTDCAEEGRRLVGPAYEIFLEKMSTNGRHKEDNRLNELREIAHRLKSGNNFKVVNGVTLPVSEEEILRGLSPEEVELVKSA